MVFGCSMFRAGLHTGEVELMGDDVAGIGVHIAARVMDELGYVGVLAIELFQVGDRLLANIAKAAAKRVTKARRARRLYRIGQLENSGRPPLESSGGCP